MASINFKGGDKLAEKLAEISAKLNGSVDIGFFEGETYPSGESVPEVAFYNEFGTSKIPARPFFRTAIEDNAEKWGLVIAKNLEDSFDSDKALKAVGQIAAEDITSSINRWTSPPNAESTKRIKDFNKPLIRTEQMLNAPSFKVK
jgi:hypothetical protein